MISVQYIRIIRYLEILLVLLLIPLLYNFIPIHKKASETIYIDASSIDSVVNSLEKNGYTVTLADKIMIQVDQVPQSGWYTLEKKKYGRFSFFKNLYKNQTTTMDIPVFAGETHNELLDRLANDTKLNRDKLYQVYKSRSNFKEAEIFAGHYLIARNADEKRVILYLFEESKKILDLFIEKNFSNKPDHFELKILLTIASIIQKESNEVEEMPMISSVIYNRINKNMKLQMDATLNYGKYSHKIVTPERIKTDTTYYNTYKYKGLPPYPLGTISLKALNAAMFPAKSDHLFFMLKPDGKHKFCASYEEHLENIRTFRAYQKAKEAEKKKIEKARDAAKEKTKKSLANKDKNNTAQSKPSSEKL